MSPATVERSSQIKSQIKKVGLVYLKPNTKVFLFGSNANKEQLDGGDLDVGILCSTPYSIEELWEFREALQATPNLYTFDVVDFSQVTKAFDEIASRNMEILIDA